MAARRIRVFVSSTYIDNKSRRQLVEQAIRSAGMEPVGMERFEASTHPPVELCLKKLAGCDLLVGVLAWRYGWIPDGSDKSITEMEYDAARERLMFLAQPTGVRRDEDMDEGRGRGAKQDKLEAFKARIAETPRYFTDETLQLAVHESLKAWKRKRNKKPRSAKRAKPTLVDPELEGNARDFVARVAQDFEGLVLMGFETKFRTPLRLDDLFVPLNVHWRQRGAERMGPRGQDEEFESRPSIVGALSSLASHDQRGLVILGYPGSGKTTQLKRILLWLAKRKPEDLELPADMLPMFLRLRLATGKEKSLLELAKATVARGEDEKSPLSGADAALLERMHERGNLLWLCDGLDEVADEKIRAHVAKLIAAAAAERKSDRFVVSCRFAGYSDDVAAELDPLLRALELAQLDDEQVATLVNNWYSAVESVVGRAQGRTAAQSEKIAKRHAAELLARLSDGKFRSSTRLAELTQNPLLLTAICLVHRDRGEQGGLPKRRADLYDECINVLLELWHKTHNVQVSIAAKDALKVLRPLALWLHSENGRRQASAREMEPIIAPRLKKIRWKGDTARFLETIRDESGLLTGYSTSTFGFVHLGFQEHLAAQELRSQLVGSSERLVELAGELHESWWQEVILLFLALEDSPYGKFLEAALENPHAAQHIDFLTQCRDEADSSTDEPIEKALAALAMSKKPSRSQLLAIDLAVRWGVAVPSELRHHASAEVRAALGPAAVTLIAVEPDPLHIAVSAPPGTVELHGSATIGVVASADIVDSARRRVRSLRGEIELVAIPGGKFWMGSTDEEIARLKREYPDYADAFDAERPRHYVALSPFFLAPTPVTNAQYARFLEATPEAAKPAYWGDRRYNQPDQPVVGVSWEDVQRFCEWAGVQLPTEAQWEYACCSGSDMRFWSGENESDMMRVGWCNQNSSGALQPVGRKPVNTFGLHDMHGNVWEWCADWYGEYSKQAQRNPAGPTGGSDRVIRGGSFRYVPVWCRSANRYSFPASNRWNDLGFRVALPAAPSSS
jgi:formylglycine-generating enzyme required for sulfatase activity